MKSILLFVFRPQLLLSLLFLCLCVGAVRAQAPTWQTAIANTGSGSCVVNATATDANGNVYIAGRFGGIVTFGSTTLDASPPRNICAFVAKWSNATKSFVWAQQSVSVRGYDEAKSIAVSGTNIYLAGAFNGGAISFGNLTLINKGSFSDDAFVVKLTDAGVSSTFTWAQQIGGVSSESAYGIAANGSNVYVAGSFSTPTSFGTIVLPGSGSSDVYVAKIMDAGATGSFIWAQSGGSSTGSEEARSIAVSGTSVYITGSFYGITSTFGNVTLTNSSNPGIYEVYVAKLTDAGTTGNFVWAQSAGGTKSDIAYGITAQGNSVYVVGEFQGPTATFGTTTLTTTDSNLDLFVAKLTDAGATGSFAWAQRAGGSEYDNAHAVAVQGNNVYITGEFRQTADFGPYTLTATGSIGASDVFVAKLTDLGNNGAFSWVQQGGGPSYDYSGALAVQGSVIYVGCTVSPPASFGNIPNVGNPNGSFTSVLASLSDVVLATHNTLTKASFAVYPNPANASTTIQIPAVANATQATLTLTDALGRQVRTQSLRLQATGTMVELPLRNLAPGVYRLCVQFGTQQAAQALLIQ
ncbi:T9SS type A sorting domain-containing protein [Hymenobacter sp. GOD-10R]|uniref:T9SS type A sorting domain-containing protein n=1 Tax=Hymenobacter sp. GOD-10R TaxID=3093922 RepID=UPI002D77A8DF|nr:T9SS type A sorting domain-containing protein [Hymenobacter sp. GOD-10R]WRQ29462.1 T9SS type A sorting domain-containing protein [Hymenobacter sp. GOD-10R]